MGGYQNPWMGNTYDLVVFMTLLSSYEDFWGVWTAEVTRGVDHGPFLSKGINYVSEWVTVCYCSSHPFFDVDICHIRQQITGFPGFQPLFTKRTSMYSSKNRSFTWPCPGTVPRSPWQATHQHATAAGSAEAFCQRRDSDGWAGHGTPWGVTPLVGGTPRRVLQLWHFSTVITGSIQTNINSPTRTIVLPGKYLLSANSFWIRFQNHWKGNS